MLLQFGSFKIHFMRIQLSFTILRKKSENVKFSEEDSNAGKCNALLSSPENLLKLLF